MFNEEEKIEYKCPVCKDEGFIIVTEWTGTDTSYEEIKRCICTYD